MPGQVQVSAQAQYKLSIVLPAYNPVPDYSERLNHLDQVLLKCSTIGAHELIIVDDGSTKKLNLENLNTERFKLIRNPTNTGKGAAIRGGTELATGDIVIYTDIDLPYTIESFFDLLRALQNAPDSAVVYGKRKEDYYEGVPLLRSWISAFHKFLVKRLFQIPEHDTQCGLKGFKGAGRNVFLQTRVDRFLFDLEFLVLAYRNRKIEVMPVEVQLRKGVQFSKMKPGILLIELVNLSRIFFRVLRNN